MTPAKYKYFFAIWSDLKAAGNNNDITAYKRVNIETGAVSYITFSGKIKKLSFAKFVDAPVSFRGVESFRACNRTRKKPILE